MTEMHIYTSWGSSPGKSSMALCAIAYHLKNLPGNDNIHPPKLLVFDANLNNANLANEWLFRFGAGDVRPLVLESAGHKTYLKYYTMCSDRVAVLQYDSEMHSPEDITASRLHPLTVIDQLMNGGSKSRLNDFEPSAAKYIHVDTADSVARFLQGADLSIKFRNITCYPWLLWTPNAITVTARSPASQTYLDNAGLAVNTLKDSFGELRTLHVLNPTPDESSRRRDSADNPIALIGSFAARVSGLGLDTEVERSGYIPFRNYAEYAGKDATGFIEIAQFIDRFKQVALGDMESAGAPVKNRHEFIGNILLTYFVDGAPPRRYKNIFAMPRYDYVTFRRLKEEDSIRLRLWMECMQLPVGTDTQVAEIQPSRDCPVQRLADTRVLQHVYHGVAANLAKLYS